MSIKSGKNDIVNTIKNLENTLRFHDGDKACKDNLRENVSKILYNGLKRDIHITKEDREFSKQLISTKKFLKNNRDLFITKSDKGNSTVLMYKHDYVEKIIVYC